MKKIKYLFIMCAAIFGLAVSASAQTKTIDVRFKKGATSATVTGRNPVYYYFRAKKGQTLRITVTPNNAGIELYMNFEPQEGADGELVWKVHETWDYQVVARPKIKGARYKMVISIK